MIALEAQLEKYVVECDRLRASQPTDEKHCPTCICGRRAPVQGDERERRNPSRAFPGRVGVLGRGPGTISWEEHLLAWSGYAARYGADQSAERLAERGGFGYGELIQFLGCEPTTWRPSRV